jgi:hypothetical protein
MAKPLYNLGEFWRIVHNYSYKNTSNQNEKEKKNKKIKKKKKETNPTIKQKIKVTNKFNDWQNTLFLEGNFVILISKDRSY